MNHGKTSSSVVAAGLTLLGATLLIAGERPPREIPLEIMLYDTLPVGDLQAGDPLEFAAAQVVGPRRIQAYIVRFRLQPGERLIAARGSILDGARPRVRTTRPGLSTARMLARLGYSLALREIPGDLHEAVAPLAGRLLPAHADPRLPKRSRSRSLVLRGETMHQRDGHAAALIMLEANALTRLQFSRVVTRIDGKKKRRARSRPMRVQSGPRITRDELLQILSGRPVETLLRNSQPLHQATAPATIAPAPEAPGTARNARGRERDHGPP